MATRSVIASSALKAPAIAALLQQEIKPVFLLGAGASVKSGIPLADPLVESIARFAYCKAHNREPDDPRLMRSDWIRWFERQAWFRDGACLADLYPEAVEHLLRPDANRREFFQRILQPCVPPSKGYTALAKLLSRRLILTVLTTNFDSLIKRTIDQTAAIHHVDEIITAGDYTLFATSPRYPQIVYLHGSINHYTDRNILRETQQLDCQLVELLRPLLRDRPLVVVGYRGTERSVMHHLLTEQAEYCGKFRHGVYWCHLPGSDPLAESKLLAIVQATIGSNLQFVEIDGFDELMVELEQTTSGENLGQVENIHANLHFRASHYAHDLEPSEIELNDLDVPLLRAKLIEYANAMRLRSSPVESEEGLLDAMSVRGLAERADATWKMAKGAQLLFAKATANQLNAARIDVQIVGPARWVDEIIDRRPGSRGQEVLNEKVEIGGNLWSQLDSALSLLSRVNRPFRLKGPVSQTVYAYPPLALRELLTNLLAHRCYTDERVAELLIIPEEIRFVNPGGLVESLQRQLQCESIQTAIDEGGRRLKGYRNPVVADFFFSAGAMDKEGSGLPDVLQEAANNLNEVKFGPTEDNSKFVAVIRCRPEALQIEEETRTAKSAQGELRYSPNLLRVVQWPTTVTKLGFVADYKQLGQLERRGVAPFGCHREWLWTFASLRDQDSKPLTELSLPEERHAVSASELLQHPDAGAVLPRLLNMALVPYLQFLDLRVRVDRGRIRAYFPADGKNPREITYRSSFRQSTRTVVKPIVSRVTGNTSYWEHKAVSLRFERFGGEWALSLLPGYFFTLDGDMQSIPSERIGPLSTRRAARDYNPTVLHDLVFWSRMLARGSETTFDLPLAGVDTTLDPRPTVVLTAMIPNMVFQEAVDAGISIASEGRPVEEELGDLQEEIEQAIAESIDECQEDEAAAN